MLEKIIMPKLGFNMDEGQLVAWLKEIGEPVKKGEPLFEINTDKTVIAIEATADGALLKTLIEVGDSVPVFTPIAVFGDANEDVDAFLAQQDDAPAQGAAAPPQQAAVAAPAPTPAVQPAKPGGAKLKITPRARRYAEAQGLDAEQLATVKGTGFDGGVTEADLAAAFPPLKATPLARKAADATGVVLQEVAGSGIGGKITKADVQAAGTSASAAAPVGGGEVDALGKRVRAKTPYKGTRRIIGERLSQSAFTAPHVYFMESVDVSAFTALRKSMNESLPEEEKVGVNDLLVLAVRNALLTYPDVNVSLVGDEVVSYASVNIGLAVAGDTGLIVPVVQNTQQKRLGEIAKESKDLVARARTGRLSMEEITTGTFTISNLGMFGIESFTAIINPPESAILAVSSVRKTPVVVTDEDGQDVVVIRPVMKLQLSADHRVIDGKLAAEFLAYVKKQIENPLLLIM